MKDLRDAFQDLRIGRLSVDSSSAKLKASANESHLRTIEEKIDSLYLMNLAALELLEEQGVSRQKILNKIEEIDLRDGKADGKVSPVSECNECGHRISQRRPHCFYCGAKVNQIGF